MPDSPEPWVIVVTSSRSVLFPPEVYSSNVSARREVDRWLDALGELLGLGTPIARNGTWTHAGIVIRLRQVSLAGPDANWLATSWRGAAPNLAAFDDRSGATRWVDSMTKSQRNMRRVQGSLSETWFAHSGEVMAAVIATKRCLVAPPVTTV